jgi:hypothetical protein
VGCWASVPFVVFVEAAPGKLCFSLCSVCKCVGTYSFICMKLQVHRGWPRVFVLKDLVGVLDS